MQADPGPGQPVAGQRVAGRPGAPGLGGQVLELAAEPDLLAEHGRAALDGQRRLGDPPAVAGRADHVGRGGARVVEEDLVELGGAGQLPDRADRDPRLVHRHQQVGQAAAAPGAGFGPGQHEAPVGQVGQRGPGLLPVDHPGVPVQHGPGGHAGQVRPGPGFGVALAPQLADLPDRRQEALLLVRRAERDQGRAEQFLAHDRDPGGRVGPRVLLVEDDLLDQARAAAAVLGGPAEAGPARGGQVLVPGEPLVVPLVLAARAARAAQPGELAGQVGLQPFAHAGAEVLVLRREPHLGLPPSILVVRRVNLPSTCLPGGREEGEARRVLAPGARKVRWN